MSVPAQPRTTEKENHGSVASVQRPNSNAPQARNRALAHTCRRKSAISADARDGSENGGAGSVGISSPPSFVALTLKFSCRAIHKRTREARSIYSRPVCCNARYMAPHGGSSGGWRNSSQKARDVRIQSPLSILLSQRPTHYVPTCAGTANLLKPCGLERWHIAHKPITRRARIDRICLKDRCPIALRIISGGLNELLGHSLAAKLSANEETDQRPYLTRFTRFILAAKRAIGRTRGDRAPGDRVAVDVPE
jgi:hypothetical protein